MSSRKFHTSLFVANEQPAVEMPCSERNPRVVFEPSAEFLSLLARHRQGLPSWPTVNTGE